MITSAELFEDLPPGSFMGLRGMLEVFAAIEKDLKADPRGPGRRMDAGTATDLDKFLFGVLRHSISEFLFDAFLGELRPFLAANEITTEFSRGNNGGGGIIQFYKAGWVRKELGVCVHFELIGEGASARIVLHVETHPYPPKDRQHLANKTALAQHLRADLMSLSPPGLVFKNPRKNTAEEGSTTIAVLPISFERLDESARLFEETYRFCAPTIERALSAAVRV
jgi:hypothetical protein